MNTHVQALSDGEAALAMHRRAAECNLAPKILARDLETVTYEHAGTTLKEWWEENDDARSQQAMKLQLQERIRELHEVGICHRDLHSENVMVSDNGVVRFIDFALAVKVDPEGPCYDLIGPSDEVPVPEAHASQPDHEQGIWWGPDVSGRCLVSVVGEQPSDRPRFLRDRPRALPDEGDG